MSDPIKNRPPSSNKPTNPSARSAANMQGNQQQPPSNSNPASSLPLNQPGYFDQSSLPPPYAPDAPPAQPSSLFQLYPHLALLSQQQPPSNSNPASLPDLLGPSPCFSLPLPSHLSPSHLSPSHLSPSHLSPSHLSPSHLSPSHLSHAQPSPLFYNLLPLSQQLPGSPFVPPVPSFFSQPSIPQQTNAQTIPSSALSFAAQKLSTLSLINLRLLSVKLSQEHGIEITPQLTFALRSCYTFYKSCGFTDEQITLILATPPHDFSLLANRLTADLQHKIIELSHRMSLNKIASILSASADKSSDTINGLWERTIASSSSSSSSSSSHRFSPSLANANPPIISQAGKRPQSSFSSPDSKKQKIEMPQFLTKKLKNIESFVDSNDQSFFQNRKDTIEFFETLLIESSESREIDLNQLSPEEIGLIHATIIELKKLGFDLYLIKKLFSKIDRIKLQTLESIKKEFKNIHDYLIIFAQLKEKKFTLDEMVDMIPLNSEDIMNTLEGINAIYPSWEKTSITTKEFSTIFKETKLFFNRAQISSERLKLREDYAIKIKELLLNNEGAYRDKVIAILSSSSDWENFDRIYSAVDNEYNSLHQIANNLPSSSSLSSSSYAAKTKK